MVGVTIEREIKASPGHVFSHIANFENILKWQPAMKSARFVALNRMNAAGAPAEMHKEKASCRLRTISGC